MFLGLFLQEESLTLVFPPTPSTSSSVLPPVFSPGQVQESPSSWAVATPSLRSHQEPVLVRRVILALLQHGTTACELDQQSWSVLQGCPSPGDAGVGDTSSMEVTGERLSWCLMLLEEGEGTEQG